MTFHDVNGCIDFKSRTLLTSSEFLNLSQQPGDCTRGPGDAGGRSRESPGARVVSRDVFKQVEEFLERMQSCFRTDLKERLG